MHYCQRCGNAIPSKRADDARRRRGTPTYCSDRCSDQMRQRKRYAKKQERAMITGLPIKAISLSNGLSVTPMAREVSLDADVRVIVLETSRAYRGKGAIRGRPTALIEPTDLDCLTVID